MALCRKKKLFLTQRRKGAKKTLKDAAALCAFAPLRENLLHAVICFLLISVLASHGMALQAHVAVPIGRWQVKFTVEGVEKNLILVAQARGVGSFLLLDTAPDNKPVAEAQPAAWSQLSNNRISFSGEVELPIGTCCREMGTVIFKGKFTSNNSIAGKLIFVTNVEDDESPYKFRSAVGTFVATRILK